MQVLGPERPLVALGFGVELVNGAILIVEIIGVN
jgi:hypothetical protein